MFVFGFVDNTTLNSAPAAADTPKQEDTGSRMKTFVCMTSGVARKFSQGVCNSQLSPIFNRCPLLFLDYCSYCVVSIGVCTNGPFNRLQKLNCSHNP